MTSRSTNKRLYEKQSWYQRAWGALGTRSRLTDLSFQTSRADHDNIKDLIASLVKL